MGDSRKTSRSSRTTPRYGFVATADIIEPSSVVRLSGRISEISRNGCYLDVFNSFPVGTEVGVRISRDKGTFASAGKIIYVQEGIGMGVLFTDTQPDQVKTLESWLAELES